MNSSTLASDVQTCVCEIVSDLIGAVQSLWPLMQAKAFPTTMSWNFDAYPSLVNPSDSIVGHVVQLVATEGLTQRFEDGGASARGDRVSRPTWPARRAAAPDRVVGMQVGREQLRLPEQPARCPRPRRTSRPYSRRDSSRRTALLGRDEVQRLHPRRHAGGCARPPRGAGSESKPGHLAGGRLHGRLGAARVSHPHFLEIIILNAIRRTHALLAIDAHASEAGVRPDQVARGSSAHAPRVAPSAVLVRATPSDAVVETAAACQADPTFPGLTIRPSSATTASASLRCSAQRPSAVPMTSRAARSSTRASPRRPRSLSRSTRC